MLSKTTIEASEVEKFSAMADEWWSETGKFKPLHQMNPCRISFIREQAEAQFGLDKTSLTPFSGLRIVDIGCGGGLISEPMARLGGDVTGVDASEKNIKIAQAHLEKSSVAVNYLNTTVEALAEKSEKFDIVLALEVVEHVADVKLFLDSCSQILKPNGLLFLATINRTPKAYAFAIVGAEYILRVLPKGTHDWKKFLKPSEIDSILGANLKLKKMAGMHYNPITERFKLTQDVSVNYIMTYGK